MQLYNRINRSILKSALEKSDQKRITLSFYRYHSIGNPGIFRNHLYAMFDDLEVFGRVYVAREGINAQLSVPEDKFETFRARLNEIDFLKEVRLNVAVEDNGKSFYKLKVKVRSKILADGLEDDAFDVTKVGKHLNAEAFNALAEKEDTIIVDMRNHYESEVGHFRKAFCPDADTFREALSVVSRELETHKDKHIIMYCTGGIRCEKASAWFRHIGFTHVYQLEGGIIKYTHDAAEAGIENKFIGKNFVFDERLGERISGDIISHCHQCGDPCDTHTNCRNVACNLLFIQCETCDRRYGGCCSDECLDIINLPEEQQHRYRKGNDPGIRIYSKGRYAKKSTDSCP